uniref:ORF2 n=1 Tax=Giant panda anellovirus TaxID=2016460 RepID=A0A220IGJ4_9VIRU|nr:ORF2 [Giant panda anellovirus]
MQVLNHIARLSSTRRSRRYGLKPAVYHINFSATVVIGRFTFSGTVIGSNVLSEEIQEGISKAFPSPQKVETASEDLEASLEEIPET